MRGLYSHSREYRKIFLRRYFPSILINSQGNSLGANTCRACIRTRANTGKYSWRIIYVFVSCQGVIKGGVCKRKRTRVNANKRRQTQISGSLRKGPKPQVNAHKCEPQRRQTRTNEKSENYTPRYAPPLTAAQYQVGSPMATGSRNRIFKRGLRHEWPTKPPTSGHKALLRGGGWRCTRVKWVPFVLLAFLPCFIVFFRFKFDHYPFKT